MPQSAWDERIKPLQALIMKPVRFNDLSVTLLDVLPALHNGDWFTEAHRHPWFEFNFVSEGALYTTVGDQEFHIEAGCSYIIPPNIFHSHRNCKNRGDDGFCLRWQLDEAVTVPEPENRSFFAKEVIRIFSVSRPFCFKANLDVLIEAVDDNTFVFTLQAVFVRWLMSLYEMWREQNKPEDSVNDHERILVQQAILYLAGYYAQDVTVKELAGSLHISYRHLARVFRSVTGMTIIQKLNDIRINHAKQLLKETDKTIRQIAREVGFENEFYFSNIFTRYSFVSPSEFRRRFKS